MTGAIIKITGLHPLSFQIIRNTIARRLITFVKPDIFE